MFWFRNCVNISKFYWKELHFRCFSKYQKIKNRQHFKKLLGKEENPLKFINKVLKTIAGFGVNHWNRTRAFALFNWQIKLYWYWNYWCARDQQLYQEKYFPRSIFVHHYKSPDFISNKIHFFALRISCEFLYLDVTFWL